MALTREIVGREQELYALEEHLLEERPLLTLVGPAGVGKTSLAMELGHALEDAFCVGDSSGVYRCELRNAKNEADCCTAIMQMFSESTRDVSRVQVQSAIARAGHCLVILDEAAHALDCLAALVRQWLPATPEARYLVTSREPLNIPEEQVFRVDPLSVDSRTDGGAAAVRMLRMRGQQLCGIDVPVEAAAKIVRALDGLPLAIELTAGQLGVLPYEEILQRLAAADARHDLGHQSGTGRHDSMQNAIEESWALLRTSEQTTLALGAQFGSTFSTEDLQQCAAGLNQVVSDIPGDILSLENKSLLARSPSSQPGNQRFLIYSPIRSFVRAACTSHAELANVGPTQRHVAWVQTRLKQAANAEPPAARHDLQMLVDEAKTVIVNAYTSPNDLLSLALDVQSAVQHRGFAALKAAIMAHALTVEGARDDSEAYIRTLLAAAKSASEIGDISRAEHYIGEAERLLASRESSDLELELKAIKIFPSAYGGRFGEAVTQADEVLAQEIFDPHLKMEVLMGRTIALLYAGRLKEAAATVQDLRTKVEQSKNPFATIRALSAECAVKIDQGQLEDALQMSEQVASISGELGEQNRLAWALCQRAGILLEMGDDRFDETVRRAQAMCKELGESRGTGLVRIMLGLRALERLDTHEVFGHLTTAAEYLKDLPADLRECLCCQAVVYHWMGQQSAAQEVLQRVERIHVEVSSENDIVTVASTMVGTPPRAPIARSHSVFGRVLVRLLPVVADQLKSSAEPLASVRLDIEGRWFQREDRGTTDLRSHGPARNMLAALARAHADGRGSLSRDELLLLGWPDEGLDRARALNRLKVTLHSLRSKGLRPFLKFAADHYRLEGHITLDECKRPPSFAEGNARSNRSSDQDDRS